MSEIETEVNSDVVAESSSETEVASSEPNSAVKSEAQVKEAPPSKQAEKEPPFHEHPRFKELINQRNELNNKYSESERSIRELRTQLEALQKPKEADPNEALYKQLKEANPVFADHFKKQMDALKELQDMKSWRENFEQRSYIQSALSEAEKAKAELKVSDREHKLYLNSIPRNTPIEQVSALYKALAQDAVKERETAIREAISKYSKEKKADSKVPASSKGSEGKMPPNVSNKMKFEKDPELRRQQLVKLVRENLKADRDI